MHIVTKVFKSSTIYSGGSFGFINGSCNSLKILIIKSLTTGKFANEYSYAFGDHLTAALTTNETSNNTDDYKQQFLNAFEQELTNLNFRSFGTKIDSGMSYQEDLDDFDGIFIL